MSDEKDELMVAADLLDEQMFPGPAALMRAISNAGRFVTGIDFRGDGIYATFVDIDGNTDCSCVVPLHTCPTVSDFRT